MQFSAKRLLDRPIIHQQLDASIGDNINGPSLIRVPDWVSEPLGKYYLYFAHHKGESIRMAYADTLTGPWQIYQSGVLGLRESKFVIDVSEQSDSMGKSAWADQLEDEYFYPHIASPDVHIDDKNKRILMYYHGLLVDGDQQTRFAVSNDGVDFEAQQELLSPPYFRGFKYGQHIYAITWGGKLWQGDDWEGPFREGPNFIFDKFNDAPGIFLRHGALLLHGDALFLFYSRIGDRPERIMVVKIELCENWYNWRIGEPKEILSPGLEWEGAQLKNVASLIGAAEEPVNQLRDPDVFTDLDGSMYLLYSGAGESAIGIASLSIC